MGHACIKNSVSSYIMRKKLVKLFIADLTPLRFVLGILALSFSIGLLFANNLAGAYDKMINVSSIWNWAAAFGIYSVARIYSCLAKKPEPSAILGSILGLWLWCYTIISFASNTVRPFGSADVMIVTVILCEIWIFSESIVNYQTNREKTNA